MKQIGWICAVLLVLGVFNTWGQSTGIMPKRGASIDLSTNRLIEKRDNTPVEEEPDTMVYEIPQNIVEPEEQPEERLSFNDAAIDMLGFDKRLGDTKESFLLRNNTPYHLSRVVIKLTYRTPEDQMINYRTQVVECDLLPHSTRRCEIPSFDTAKSYYHVDSPPARSSGRPFKVSFRLLRYDVVVEP